MSKENIEDIYPLSPMQQGMLFHSLYTPETDVYFYQAEFTLRGRLDVVAYEKTWQRVVSRHPILRSAFIWERGQEPFQVVRQRVKLPWAQLDWRDFSPAEQQEKLAAFLKADRERGLELSKAPLMRVTLVQLADDVSHLIWSHHHLLLDGWSVALVLKETFSIYEALRRGEDLQLEQPRPYGDYIAWLQRQDMKQAEHFWREKLKGFTAPIKLGVERTSTSLPEKEQGYDDLTIGLTDEEAAKLNAFAQQQKLTLNTLVQGAWAVLMARYSGEENVVFGATTSGRPVELNGVESMIGNFINTLPVCIRVTAQAKTLDWLRQLQKGQVEARQFEYSPLVQIQKWSEIPRGESLFEVLVAFANYPIDASLSESRGGLEIGNPRVDDRTNYPLALIISAGTRFSLRFIYDRNRYDADTIGRMRDHLKNILMAMIERPEERLSYLPMLTEPERRQILSEWNETTTGYEKDRCPHELFETQVEATPDAIALVSEDERLTYGELNARANQLARHLRRLGVRPETLVAICLERSVTMVVAVLGVLKAGGAYVPLDHAYPKERLAFMLEDSRPLVLLTQQPLLASLPEHKALTLCIDTDSDLIKRESTENLSSTTTPRNLAYVIYTSGSTGRPKGVLLELRGINNLATVLSRRCGVRTSSRVLQFASFSFDSVVAELFMTLLSGATLFLVTKESLLAGPETAELLRKLDITTMIVPPTFLAALPAQSLPSLHAVITAGETCSAELVSRWAEGRTFINGYGPTESTVCTTLGDCVDANRKPSIGRPIQNVHVYLLNEQLQPVPVGVGGELHIAYDGIARGYLNRPQLTAEKFIPNPFSPTPGDRLYKSGDRARYLASGEIDFLGRLDNQVKIRGFRVELGEIEAALLQHSGIREAVVVAREEPAKGKHVVAYVVPDVKPEHTANNLPRYEENDQLAGPQQQEPANGDVWISPNLMSEVRSFLKEKLPDYMMPSAFVQLQALPLTSSGKVDRRALPVPAQSKKTLAGAFVPPRTAVEEVLAKIWADVLGVDRVGINDNFFELGGDSILSIQVNARANKAGLKLTTKQLFQHRTIAELAAVANTPEAITAEQGLVSGNIPLTPIQRSFFAEQQAEPHHFNQSLLLQLNSPVDVAALRRAFNHLVSHHDALRLRFRQTAAGWQQFNAGSETNEFFSVVDLSRLSGAEQAAELEKHAAELQASLDLNAGPLLRVCYYEMGNGAGARLLIVIHHLAVDGVSWRILLEDLAEQVGAGGEIGLEAKTTSFKAWAERLWQYAQEEEVQGQREYWRGLVGRARQVKRLPVDQAGGENTVAEARTVEVSLSREETAALLSEVPAVYRTQINEVLLTALAEVIGSWTGARQVLLEMEGHGREEIGGGMDVTRTVGWFTTHYPVVLEVEAGLGEALKAVKEQLRGVPGHGLGWGLLRWEDGTEVSELEAAAELSFNYLGQFDQLFSESSPFTVAPESAGSEQSLKARRRHLIVINAMVIEGKLRIRWGYSSAVHHDVTIENLANNYVEALQDLIEHCGSNQAGGYTPSDFPEFRWNQADLDEMSTAISESLGKISHAFEE